VAFALALVPSTAFAATQSSPAQTTQVESAMTAVVGTVGAAGPVLTAVDPGVAATYDNLYAAVQGETNANAEYLAFAAQAKADGYPAVANLFIATAAAEQKHSDDEWAVLVTLGATDRPVAAAPTVGTTAENLQTAINGEYYEYTTMYPDFLATAQDEGVTAAARIFNFAQQAEQIHYNNYSDVLANLDNPTYLNATYKTVYRCPVCGAVFTPATLPSSRCNICGTAISAFVVYNLATYDNLYTAVQGETNAVANYTAFAAKAQAEGYPTVARLFTATAAAEQTHADAEWAVLVSMGATDRPVADTPVVGTTAENLTAAIAGEDYEWTTMYPGFLATAQDEGVTAAARIFNLAQQAEHLHYNNYSDVLANLGNPAYLLQAYSTIYRCPVCGAIFTQATLPTSGRCSICGTSESAFIVYGPDIVSVTPTAFVQKLSGNQNNLTVNVTVKNSDGLVTTTSTTLAIASNSAGTYTVGNYKVYVDTKGNDQIRACYIVQ